MIASLECANWCTWEIAFGVVFLLVCLYVCVLTIELASGQACSMLLILVYNRSGSHIT